MLFNDFLLHLLYLVIQINAVHVTMLKSTDDVLQKPIKNKYPDMSFHWILAQLYN